MYHFISDIALPLKPPCKIYVQTFSLYPSLSRLSFTTSPIFAFRSMHMCVCVSVCESECVSLLSDRKVKNAALDSAVSLYVSFWRYREKLPK